MPTVDLICKSTKDGKRCTLSTWHIIWGYPVHTAADQTRWRDDGKIVCEECLGNGEILHQLQIDRAPTMSLKCLQCNGTGIIDEV